MTWNAIDRLRRAAVRSAALLAFSASSLLAQDPLTVAGYGAGWIHFGALNPGAGTRALVMDAGWILTAFGESWHVAGGRAGARLSGGWSQRPVDLGGQDIRDISTWLFDAGMAVRPLTPREGDRLLPFLSAGAGLIHYGFGTGTPRVFVEQGVVYFGDEQIRWTAVAAGGIDIVPGGVRVAGTPLGLRIEISDHVVFRSPFRRIGDEAFLGPIHNIRLGASLIGIGSF